MEASRWISLDDDDRLGSNRRVRPIGPRLIDLTPSIDEERLQELDAIHPYGFDEGLGDSRRARERARDEQDAPGAITFPPDAAALRGLKAIIDIEE